MKKNIILIASLFAISFTSCKKNASKVLLKHDGKWNAQMILNDSIRTDESFKITFSGKKSSGTYSIDYGGIISTGKWSGGSYGIKNATLGEIANLSLTPNVGTSQSWSTQKSEYNKDKLIYVKKDASSDPLYDTLILIRQ